jgi:hypothetical protein
VSAVAVITPIVIANWPLITAAVTAAVTSMGFTTVEAAAGRVRVRRNLTNRAEVELEESAVVEAATEGEIVVERADGVRATISRDARGALKVCAEGEHLSNSELREIAEDLAGRITQQYVYNKLMTELSERNVAVVDQEVTADQTIKIRIRNP